jgi:hypothetical protein
MLNVGPTLGLINNRKKGLGKENRAWRAGTGWLQGSSLRVQAGTARKEERAGRRGAGQVGTGEGWLIYQDWPVQEV